MKKVLSGLEVLLTSPPDYINGKRLGLLCNPASIDRNFIHSRLLIDRRFPDSLKVLFSPQHGFFAEKQDNMIESDHMTDPVLNIPVYSLYGKARIPDETMFEEIDILLIDIQDVGTRVYTFIYTISYCMEVAARLGKKVVILDRPNPLGGNVTEGNVLDMNFASFVGRYPIPMRHGLTTGEIARLFNTHFEIGCDLEIISMTGWRRAMYFEDTGLPWVPPSPNLPVMPATAVYPGQVVLEGTNISEGRGTTQPFEVFGAPFLNTESINKRIKQYHFKGFHLRPVAFQPVAGKWKDQPCMGFQIHIINRRLYEPYITSLALLQAILDAHKDAFEYKQPPYEYEYVKLPFDLITGDDRIRHMVEAMLHPSDIKQSWQTELYEYRKQSRHYLLYS